MPFPSRYQGKMPLQVLNFLLLCIVDALLIIGVPDGPTAHFKLSKLVLRKDIKVCNNLQNLNFEVDK